VYRVCLGDTRPHVTSDFPLCAAQHQNTPSNRCGLAIGLKRLSAPAFGFLTTVVLGFGFTLRGVTLVTHMGSALDRATRAAGLHSTRGVVEVRQSTRAWCGGRLSVRNATLAFNVSIGDRLWRFARR